MNLRLFLSILFIYIGTYSYTQQLKLDKGPEDYQLFARDKNDKATVLFSGSVTDDAKFNELRLKVYKDGVLYDNKSVKIENREFKFSSIIQAGLFQYRFELYHQIESVEKLSFIADNVVCGDAYIITGQSNSHASSNKSSYTSPFCRSFGVKTGYEKYTDEDKKIRWGLATGNCIKCKGDGWEKGFAGGWFVKNPYGVGVWGMELAQLLVEKYKIPVHISHIKCLGRDVWHQSDSIIKLIEFYRNKGLSITANQYPYDASATSLKGAVVPRWAESGGKDSLFIRFNNNKLKLRILSETSSNIFRRGGADKLLIVNSKNSNFIGKNLLELSEIFTKSPEETVYELIESENIQVASFNMIEEDIINFMKQSWVFTGSDGNTGHPRKYGSFPKKYSEYVVNKKVLNLSEFIANSTSKPAEFFNVNKRGKIKEGYYADIIIFDPLYFKDKADYSNAFVYSEGLIYSIINGELIIDKNNFTGQLKGKVLKK